MQEPDSPICMSACRDAERCTQRDCDKMRESLPPFAGVCAPESSVLFVEIPRTEADHLLLRA